MQLGTSAAAYPVSLSQLQNGRAACANAIIWWTVLSNIVFPASVSSHLLPSTWQQTDTLNNVSHSTCRPQALQTRASHGSPWNRPLRHCSHQVHCKRISLGPNSTKICTGFCSFCKKAARQIYDFQQLQSSA